MGLDLLSSSKLIIGKIYMMFEFCHTVQNFGVAESETFGWLETPNEQLLLIYT